MNPAPSIPSPKGGNRPNSLPGLESARRLPGEIRKGRAAEIAAGLVRRKCSDGTAVDAGRNLLLCSMKISQPRNVPSHDFISIDRHIASDGPVAAAAPHARVGVHASAHLDLAHLREAGQCRSKDSGDCRRHGRCPQKFKLSHRSHFTHPFPDFRKPCAFILPHILGLFATKIEYASSDAQGLEKVPTFLRIVG